MHYCIKVHNSNRKMHFFNSFRIKARRTKFDLAINRSRSTQSHHLYKLKGKNSPNATYQVSRQSASGSREKSNSLKLLPYMGMAAISVM